MIAIDCNNTIYQKHKNIKEIKIVIYTGDNRGQQTAYYYR